MPWHYSKTVSQYNSTYELSFWERAAIKHINSRSVQTLRQKYRSACAKLPSKATETKTVETDEVSVLADRKWAERKHRCFEFVSRAQQTGWWCSQFLQVDGLGSSHRKNETFWIFVFCFVANTSRKQKNQKTKLQTLTHQLVATWVLHFLCFLFSRVFVFDQK